MHYDRSKADNEKNSERVWVRLPPSLKACLEARAKAARRELAVYARMVLEKDAERSGKKKS